MYSSINVKDHSLSDPKDVEKDVQNSVFIPKFIQKAGNPDENYKLFYGPSNAFMFLLLFYSLYERVLKAQRLVKQKVEQDFKEDFSKREWSVKF